MFCDERTVRTGTAFDQSLGLVDKGVRQRIRADIADRKALALLFEDEIHVTGGVPNASRGDGAGEPHAMVPRRAGQRLILRDRVIVGLAFAVAEPSQERQGDDDNANTDTEFSALLHKTPPPKRVPAEILAQEKGSKYGM